MAPDELELWTSLRDPGSPADARERARQELLAIYLPLVRIVVSRLAVNFPSATVEGSDMIQSGVIGLMEAVERFDPGLNVAFRTYAQARIRGSVLDELRALDWAPRSVRDKARQLSQAQESLGAELKRPPTPAETAAALNLSPEAFDRLAEEAQRRSVGSLEAMLENEGEGPGWPAHDPAREDLEQRRGLLEALQEGMGLLAERDRLLLKRYYEHDRTLREIAEELGVTESRVCQVHAALLTRLREWVSRRLRERPGAAELYRQLARS